MKSVIILGILVLKVGVGVMSAIFIVSEKYSSAAFRYYSPAVYRVNGKEINYPSMGTLVSPE